MNIRKEIDKNYMEFNHNIIEEVNSYDIGDIVNVVEYNIYNGVVCGIEYRWSRKEIVYTIRYWDECEHEFYEVDVNEYEIEYVGMGAYL